MEDDHPNEVLTCTAAALGIFPFTCSRACLFHTRHNWPLPPCLIKSTFFQFLHHLGSTVWCMMLFSFKLATLLLMAVFYLFYVDDSLNQVSDEMKFWLRLVMSQKQLKPARSMSLRMVNIIYWLVIDPFHDFSFTQFFFLSTCSF